MEVRGLGGTSRVFDEALERWQPRVADLAPQRDLQTVHRFGGRLLVPEGTDWPAALSDLGQAMPFGLWTRGGAKVPELGQCLALVGSRDATSYGLAVTGDLAAGVVQRGRTVISGGAYGIDAQAHRSALALGGGAGGSETRAACNGTRPAAAGSTAPPTIAVLAGGVDRFYPAGNEDLLRAVAGAGLILSEVAPGSAPTRWRFLHQKRKLYVFKVTWDLSAANPNTSISRPTFVLGGSSRCLGSTLI